LLVEDGRDATDILFAIHAVFYIPSSREGGNLGGRAGPWEFFKDE
jgi:hypothetical protein